MTNKRIKLVASLINDAKTILDIGCDHGYLLLEALKKDANLNCYAIEVNVGPLENAKNTLKNYNNVKYVLSDGLKDFNDDFDLATICGMGGELIRKILEDSKEKFKGKTLILGPQSDNNLVREWLYLNNYEIVVEKNIVENNKYYEIIKAVYNKANYNYFDISFGPFLFKEKNNEYLNHYNKLLNNKIKGLKSNNLKIKEDVLLLNYAIGNYKFEEYVNLNVLLLSVNSKSLIILDNKEITDAFKYNLDGYDVLIKKVGSRNYSDLLRKYQEVKEI